VLSLLKGLLGDPDQARLVAEPSALDERQRRRLAAWSGVPARAVERAGREGLPLPLGPQTEAIAARDEAERLEGLALPVAVEADVAPFHRAAAIALKVGLLGALVNGAEVLIAEGLEQVMTGPPGAWVVFGVIIPAAIGALMAMGGLPTALTLGALGQLRRRGRHRTLEAGARLLDSLGHPALTGRAGELLSRAVALQRVVIEADLPAPVEADLLAALSTCIEGLPALSEMAEQVDSRPDLERRLADALVVASEHLAAVESALTARAVQPMEGGEEGSSIERLRRATAAFQATLQRG